MVEFFLAFDTSMNRDCLEVVTQSIHIIPSCLRTFDSMFTQMIVLQTNTGHSSSFIPAHIDDDDHVNAILT